MARVSLAEARRIALAAQGFGARSAKPRWATISKALDHLKLLQIDSVNVLVRSHYLPVFARAGNYSQATLDERSFKNAKRHFFECWSHEASLVPLSLHPLMRWRMDRSRAHDGTYREMDRFGRENKAFLKSCLAHVEKHGPTRVRDIPDAGKGKGGWWGWSKGKLALETLFDQGLLTTGTRENFERIYDLPERVIPAEVLALPTPPEADAFRELMLLAAEALGIATEADLIDYFRLPRPEARRALAELMAARQVLEVEVEGWKHKAYLHPAAKRPRRIEAQALLSPFDPVVWNRDRADRLFDFHYRIELYTPADKRRYGYYVLPFLMGDRLVARLCLKSDREKNVLRVNTAHGEAGIDAARVVKGLADELRLMSRWLGLDGVEVMKKGDLAGALGKVV